jgi:exopolysaccharide biosynthesis predicted pyruvyltransferase EpsI
VFHALILNARGVDVGNNGDDLIIRGAEELLPRMGIQLVDSPDQADVVAIRGSGSMLERYVSGAACLSHYSQNYPDKPLCVLPSSYLFPTTDLAQLIGQRSAPVTLFCREAYSYQHLTAEQQLPDTCSVALDDDMAFHLADSPLVAALTGREGRHLLMVERADAEHASRWRTREGSAARPVGRSLRSLVPLPIKRMLYPAVNYLRSRHPSQWRQYAEGLVQREFPDLAGMPRVVQDISMRRVCDFDGFCQAVADASVVLTTRLHVGVMGALLNKPTVLFDGGYHKILGIYRQSMQNMPHVRVVEVDQWAGNAE